MISIILSILGTVIAVVLLAVFAVFGIVWVVTALLKHIKNKLHDGDELGAKVTIINKTE